MSESPSLKYEGYLRILPHGRFDKVYIEAEHGHANRANLFTAAEGKSKRELEELLAARFARPDAPMLLRRLPAPDAPRGGFALPLLPLTASSPAARWHDAAGVPQFDSASTDATYDRTDRTDRMAHPTTRALPNHAALRVPSRTATTRAGRAAPQPRRPRTRSGATTARSTPPAQSP